MTRINCVPVTELSREHLVAEWRELPRVFALAENAHMSRRTPRSPERYTLGTGHVLFFYTRLGYVLKRWWQLRDEMLVRGYKPSYEEPPKFRAPPEWLRDWAPDEHDLQLNRARIAERMRA